MSPAQVIGLKDRAGWKPAIAMIQEWRRANVSPPLPVGLVMADAEGRPSPTFRGLWRAAFSDPLPLNLVMVSEARPTREFIDLWERAT